MKTNYWNKKIRFFIVQETAWTYRGPHQHHYIFERFSQMKNTNIVVYDYDIEHKENEKGWFNKKTIFNESKKTINSSGNIIIIRSACLNIPFLRRISSLIFNFFDIIKEIKKQKPNAMIVYSISNGMIAFFLSKLFDIPMIFHYYEPLHELISIKQARSFAKFISIIVLKSCDYIYTISEKLSNYVFNLGVNKSKIEYLPLSIDKNTRLFELSVINSLKKELNIRENDLTILFLGYLYDFAGLFDIVDYFNEKVLKGEVNIKFLIVGGQGVYNELMKHIEQIGATSWVIMTNQVPFSIAQKYIYCADICLLPFKLNDITRDIIPYKIYNYLAVGKPVFSTALPGVVKHFSSVPSVLFFKDLEELLKNILQFINKKEDLKRLGEKGKKYIEEMPSNYEIMIRIVKKIQEFSSVRK